MNANEIKNEIKSLNQQIKTVEKQGAQFWQQVMEIDEQIALIHYNRQQQLSEYQRTKTKLVEILSDGELTSQEADSLNRLQTIIDIPVEQITRSLEIKKGDLKKQHHQILYQTEPLRKKIVFFENALEVRHRLDRGENKRNVTDWLYDEKRFSNLEIDELMEIYT